jgi:GTP pyrophosphokinase
MDIEKIYDISAVRVIVPTVEECYRVLGIIHSAWRRLTGRIKDYISTPKPNGYQSLHTTIFSGDGNIIEVQIRTEEMHRDAEYGITSHTLYKHTQEGIKKQAGQNLSWVSELAQYQKSGSDKKSLEDLKTDFFEERIFVFTPNGDVIDLPSGSSAIDFAYNIHSDIGDHMSGVKINGKFVALSTALQSGDLVEIETKKSAKPNHKWIEFCKTTIAKRRIKNFLESRM